MWKKVFASLPLDKFPHPHHVTIMASDAAVEGQDPDPNNTDKVDEYDGPQRVDDEKSGHHEGEGQEANGSASGEANGSVQVREDLLIHYHQSLAEGHEETAGLIGTAVK